MRPGDVSPARAAQKVVGLEHHPEKTLQPLGRRLAEVSDKPYGVYLTDIRDCDAEPVRLEHA